MKRIISILLMLMLMISVVGCAQTPANDDKKEEGTKTEQPKDEAPTQEGKSALDTLAAIWDNVKEEEKFPVFGGDENNFADNAPGKFDVTNAEGLESVAIFPEAHRDNVSEAATMVHGMIQNNFTAAAFKLKDAEKAPAYATDYQTAIGTRQWMCGFPEKFVVIQAGDVIVTAFGSTQAIDIFKKSALEALGNSQLLLEENITL